MAVVCAKLGVIARRTDPTPSTVKRLFALSCNTCAYRGCEEQLADPSWKSVQADLAHINGENPGAARYDDGQTDDERRAFENIILLCPNHHRLVDLLDPDNHPVALLRDMKAQHEESCGRAVFSWASDSDLDRYTVLLLTREPSSPPPTGAPRLVIDHGSGDSYEVVNVGDAEAFDVRVVLEDDKTRDAVILTGESQGQLSPGGRWGAFLYAQTMGNAGPHAVRLVWTDELGQTFHGVFPVS